MNMIRKALAAIEPWYDWGRCEVLRMDALRGAADFSDEVPGRVGRFELQWLGVHLAFEVGRTPRN